MARNTGIPRIFEIYDLRQANCSSRGNRQNIIIQILKQQRKLQRLQQKSQ